ncbi:MAG: hypothetical protein KA397_07845 [Paludibacteraceae bacterium]|nr:hypothetical protein [Paludibacteraceae bacterium]MBP6284979.1 hypothetical protein [Paludibacteraceae bacterium]
MKRIFFFVLISIMSSAYAATLVTPETLAKREKRKFLTVKEWNTDAKGKTSWLDHLTVYDDEGRKVEEIEYANYGQKSRVTSQYDNVTGKVVREIEYDYKNKPIRIRKYEYNNDGSKKKQYNYLPNGKLFSVKGYEYIFTD